MRNMTEVLGKDDYTNSHSSNPSSDPYSDFSSDLFANEDAIVAELAAFLESEFTPDELETAKARYVESIWPSVYTNSETKRVYEPHSEEERLCCFQDTPLNLAVLGGEGSGKSTMGVIKTLERLRRGMSGILASPDLEHLKRSLWPEFRRWCPWDRVTPRLQYLQELDRLPQKPFHLVFNNDVGTQSVLMCGGAYEAIPEAWEGPNVNFAHFDEMRRHKTAAILKVISGRVRIPGPNGESPQLWMTTTPRKHWLYDYFGELICKCEKCHAEYEWGLTINTVPTCPKCHSLTYTTNDPLHEFKLQSAVLRLSTKDNEKNLYTGFSKRRALSLSAKEARVLLDAAWEDTEDDSQFLPSMELWDRLNIPSVPPLTATDPIVLGVDAGKGRFNDQADCFAIVGVSRHWDNAKRREHCVVRYVRTWTATSGNNIDFLGTESDPGPEIEIRRLCSQYNVIQVAYDPYQLHDMMTRIQRDHVAWTEEVGQGKERLQADSDLLQVIIEGRITHSGERILREHVYNADKSVDDAGSKCRIVKREEKRKIDAAVALSMAVYRCLSLNIGYDKVGQAQM